MSDTETTDAAGINPSATDEGRDELNAARPRPRTRWAAIIWGLVLSSAAAAGLWVLLEPARRSGVADWVLGLTPLSIAAYAILLVGALALVTGFAGLARRLQRRFPHTRTPEDFS